MRGASKGDGMLVIQCGVGGKKREPKKVALSVRETAIVSSEWKSEGNVERQKLLEILLVKDQKDLLVEEDERSSHFF